MPVTPGPKRLPDDATSHLEVTVLTVIHDNPKIFSSPSGSRLNRIQHHQACQCTLVQFAGGIG
ncbi:hypothetical protein BGY98DRAFT_1052422, partial [Russula aff. rugulosa BPL654]